MPEFILGDKLPLVSETVIAIVTYAPGGPPDGVRQTALRQEAVGAYATALIGIWTKAFGEENVASRKTVKNKIVSHIKTYHNAVYGSKNKGKKSKRERIRECHKENESLFDILKFGIDASKFDDYERQFYERQKAQSREGFLSEDIDENFKDRVAKRMDIVKVNDKAISNVIEDDYLLEEMSDLDIENEWEIQNIRTQKMRLKNSKVIYEAVQEEKEN